MVTQIILDGHDYHNLLKEDRTGCWWTKEEISYLKKHYPSDDTYKVAEYLGRHYHAVRTKALRLNLLKIRKTKTIDYVEPIKSNVKSAMYDRIIGAHEKRLQAKEGK